MRADLRLFDAPGLSFLIFASPKSGTTWLQRLLSSHPEVVCAESRVFGDYFAANPLSQPHLTLQKYVSIVSHYFAPSVDGLRTADTAFYKGLLFNTVDTFAATTLRATGKRLYGEKLTPYRQTAAGAVDLLREYNPNVRFVNLVRDGRDVIVSGAAQWLNLRLRQATGDDRIAFDRALRERRLPDEEFERFLSFWIDAVRAGLDGRAKFARYLDVRYEQCLANPTGAATTLFTFLGIDASPLVVRQTVAAASFETLSGGRSRGDEDPTSFFRKGVAGDWENWFTPTQRDTFHERAGDLMALCGYASADVIVRR